MNDIFSKFLNYALIPTNLSIAIPEGTCARIGKSHFAPFNLCSQMGYHFNVNFEVKVGDRIAQLILEKIVTPDVMEVRNL
uniref:dUTP diphosphatase n=1 Tax=Populus trichocarpa TaxID=3694 RepID=A0A2K1XXZ8_POPTR